MKFTIPGEPTGKARPRVTRSGHAYTTERTVIYENLVKVCWQDEGRGERFGESVPLRMTLRCFYGTAASDSRRRQRAKLDGAIRPMKKPDLDNVVKIIADALNGLAYRDDSQIVELDARKYYGEAPRVEVEIVEVG